MKSWDEIVKWRGLSENRENIVHPHADIEDAHLYSAKDGGATEFEFLNLIHALIIAFKPERVLECGTYRGMGTLAIAHALHFNNYGILTTIDIDPVYEAKQMLSDEGLINRVDFVTTDALKFCKDTELKFNFIFIDSGPTRAEECEALLANSSILPQGIVCFHDASPFRTNPDENKKEVSYLSKIKRTIRIHKSRGFEFFQL